MFLTPFSSSILTIARPSPLPSVTSRMLKWFASFPSLKIYNLLSTWFFIQQVSNRVSKKSLFVTFLLTLIYILWNYSQIVNDVGIESNLLGKFISTKLGAKTFPSLKIYNLLSTWFFIQVSNRVSKKSLFVTFLLTLIYILWNYSQIVNDVGIESSLLGKFISTKLGAKTWQNTRKLSACAKR